MFVDVVKWVILLFSLLQVLERSADTGSGLIEIGCRPVEDGHTFVGVYAPNKIEVEAGQKLYLPNKISRKRQNHADTHYTSILKCCEVWQLSPSVLKLLHTSFHTCQIHYFMLRFDQDILNRHQKVRSLKPKNIYFCSVSVLN